MTMGCPLGSEVEAGLRERLARIETEARHAREIATDQADDIGRIMERLDLQEMRIERNERSIWDVFQEIRVLRDGYHSVRDLIAPLTRDREHQRTVLAVMKYVGAGALLFLAFTGQLTHLQASMLRGIFGLP